MNITIGADPELFLRKGGQFCSAYGLIPGTKIEPYPVEHGAVQVDGMAVEFNIDPAGSKDEFNYNIHTVLNQLRAMVPKEYQIENVSDVCFPQDYLKSQPEEAVRLGCDPDFNAYTGNVNPPPQEGGEMRTAAGHIHIGWENKAKESRVAHYEECCMLTKQLDYLLGIPSILLDRDGFRRRKMYGQAGAFRPKPYGMEYRVLSNFWLKSDALMEWVYENTKQAFYLLAEKDIFLEDKRKEEARWIINFDEHTRARQKVKELSDYLIIPEGVEL